MLGEETKGDVCINHVYKVIWSKTKHCSVVVSELVKNNVKGASEARKIRRGRQSMAVLTLAVMLSLAGFSGIAQAYYQAGGTGASATGDNSMAIASGSAAVTASAKNTIAIGTDSAATTIGSVAIGNHVQASGGTTDPSNTAPGSVAIGSSVVADWSGATAIGMCPR